MIQHALQLLLHEDSVLLRQSILIEVASVALASMVKGNLPDVKLPLLLSRASQPESLR